MIHDTEVKLNVLSTYTMINECTCCALRILEGWLFARYMGTPAFATSSPSSWEVAK